VYQHEEEAQVSEFHAKGKGLCMQDATTGSKESVWESVYSYFHSPGKHHGRVCECVRMYVRSVCPCVRMRVCYEEAERANDE
jgi:hypothetical protein